MTKNKRPRMSIRFKIWFGIAGTVIAAVATIWLLQVVYLEDYYLRNKQTEFQGIVQTVTDMIDSQGIISSKDALYDLASQHMLCIEISDKRGKMIVKYEGLNYNCYVHKNVNRRRQFLALAQQNPNNKIMATVDGANSVKEFFICAAAGKALAEETEGTLEVLFITDTDAPSPDMGIPQFNAISDSGDYIVLVSIALAPVREASLAIRNQFLVVSAIILAIAMLIAAWLSRGLTRNIIKIKNAASEVARGNLEVDVTVKSNDEMGDLSKSFGEMTKEIGKVNLLQKELVANISHDIRTPLTMIKGYAETIKDITGDDKEARSRQLDIIIGESNRLSTLVNDVMDLSLMQAGQSPLKIQDFDLVPKISDILSRFELLEQTRGFEFVLDSEGDYRVSADPVRIEQVLYNLINNAVNHIGEQKRITVSVARDNGEIKVSVEDTGVGIAQEDLPLIWDRYYKPYKNTERKSVGTGLGLSIVKAILTNHKSSFGVTSTIGVGSNFWFTLKEAPKKEDTD